jgi:hypothetical protein
MAEMDDKVIVTKDKITDIADTIRETGGTSARMTLDEMPDNIRAIGEGGGNVDAPLFVCIYPNTVTCNLTFAKIEEIYAGTGDTKASMPQLIYKHSSSSDNGTRSVSCDVTQYNEDTFIFTFDMGFGKGINKTEWQERIIEIQFERGDSLSKIADYTLEYQKPVVAGDGIELENVGTGINRKTQISVVDALMIINESSGSVASFDDGGNDMPLKSCIVSIEPVQSGSGDPSPSNVRPISGWTECNLTRTGKNIAQLTYGNQVPSINTGEMVSANGWSSQFIIIEKSLNYCFSLNENPTTKEYYILYYGKDKNYLGYTIKPTYTGYSLNTSPYWENTKYIKFRLGDTDQSSLRVQLEVGSTATDYEPYQANTYNIEFPSEAGTVYGGTLDVTNGVLTVTDGYIASYNGETLPSTWISSMDVYAEGTTPTTGAEVVYKLATPQTYNVTPTEIKTLLGINNIFADCGDADVEYVRDATLIINKLLELASGNNNRTMMKSAVVEKTDEVQEQKKDSVEEDFDA